MPDPTYPIPKKYRKIYLGLGFGTDPFEVLGYRNIFGWEEVHLKSSAGNDFWIYVERTYRWQPPTTPEEAQS